MSENVTFSFGRNWQEFLRSLSGERVVEAERSLTEWIGELRGRTFLDIGCGSGLFSYAAWRLGAEVFSFDLDPASVECCTRLRAQAGDPPRWEIRQASVLDESFLSRLGKFDVVYSWGVLHHTGAMFDAIRAAARHVGPAGVLHLALYNRVGGPFGSKFWLGVKRLYNALPGPGKKLTEWAYMAAFFAVSLAKLRNPLRRIREYKSHRGMNWRTDVIDWLGGLPYEAATAGEIVEFMKREFPELSSVRVQETRSVGCNWFLFRRSL